jgi:Mn-dependent DtxR family transcriptional regulator
MHDVRLEALHRLAALDLVRHGNGGWTLTNAGSALLLRLVDGERIEPLA